MRPSSRKLNTSTRCSAKGHSLREKPLTHSVSSRNTQLPKNETVKRFSKVSQAYHYFNFQFSIFGVLCPVLLCCTMHGLLVCPVCARGIVACGLVDADTPLAQRRLSAWRRKDEDSPRSTRKPLSSAWCDANLLFSELLVEKLKIQYETTAVLVSSKGYVP